MLDLALVSFTTSVPFISTCIMLILLSILTPLDKWNPAYSCMALLIASSKFLGRVLLHNTLSVMAVLFMLARKCVHLEGSMFSLGANPVTILCALVLQ